MAFVWRSLLAFVWRALLVAALCMAATAEYEKSDRLIRSELASHGEILKPPARSSIVKTNETGTFLQITAGRLMELSEAEAAIIDLAHRTLKSYRLEGNRRPEEVSWDHLPKQIWIRDLASHIEESLEAGADPEETKNMLLTFFLFQSPSGSIPDWFNPGNGNTGKNTASTDQETSLIQAVHKYVKKTGDMDILKHEVATVEEPKLMTVQQRIELAINFLLRERLSPQHHLLFGGTTVDFGDIQPETDPLDRRTGHAKYTMFDQRTHPSVDVYDNAMMILALQEFAHMCNEIGDSNCTHKSDAMVDKLKKQTREVMWDTDRQKWRPHVYFKEGSWVTQHCHSGSPFPDDFDEDRIYVHGGTIMAMLAGLHTKEEAKAAYQQMRQNADKAVGGNATIGLSVYPPYPPYFWKTVDMPKYTHHNGGEWPLWAGKAVQALVHMGLLEEAREALNLLVVQSLKSGTFREWYDIKPHSGPSSGSLPFGKYMFPPAAGAIAKAVRMLKRAEKKAAGSVVTVLERK